MGSVKDLIVLSSPHEEEPGRGKFIFSDRYSVFDWGEMPDHIPLKGASLCLIGAYFFERLEEAGFLTHYQGVEEEGKLKRLSDLKSPTNQMIVSLVRVIQPPEMEGKYDYNIYQGVRGNFLIPFEFIYRNSLPAGSSLRKRLEKGEIKLEDYGWDKIPAPEERLSPPIVDVSTKLEEQDRYLSWREVEETGILQKEEIEKIRQVILAIDDLITKEVEKINLKNEDGKIELALDKDRNLVVVDVVGTPDESRFTYRGMHLSKEIAREFYRKTPWYEEVQKAKLQNPVGWRGLVKTSPPPLPSSLLQLISWVYERIAMDLTNRDWFPNVPSLEEIGEIIGQELLI